MSTPATPALLIFEKVDDFRVLVSYPYPCTAPVLHRVKSIPQLYFILVDRNALIVDSEGAGVYCLIRTVEQGLYFDLKGTS